MNSQFSKKEIFLVLFVAVLGVLYVHYFTGWFKPKFIRIESTVRSLREAWTGGGQRADLTKRPAESVTFSFHRDYQLTSVEVVSVAELQTNKYAPPLWHLVSKNGSAPVNGVVYGADIPNMAPFIANAEARSLEPGVEYRLIVEAHSIRGTNDFSIPAARR